MTSEVKDDEELTDFFVKVSVVMTAEAGFRAESCKAGRCANDETVPAKKIRFRKKVVINFKSNDEYYFCKAIL